jgi:hypothetical protein
MRDKDVGENSMGITKAGFEYLYGLTEGRWSYIFGQMGLDMHFSNFEGGAHLPELGDAPEPIEVQVQEEEEEGDHEEEEEEDSDADNDDVEDAEKDEDDPDDKEEGTDKAFESPAYKKLQLFYNWVLGTLQSEFLSIVVREPSDVADAMVEVSERMLKGILGGKMTREVQKWRSDEEDEKIPEFTSQQRDVIIKGMNAEVSGYVKEFTTKVFAPHAVQTAITNFFGQELSNLIISKARVLMSKQIELTPEYLPKFDADGGNTELQWEPYGSEGWDAPLTIAHVLKRLEFITATEDDDARQDHTKIHNTEDEVRYVAYLLRKLKILPVYFEGKKTLRGTEGKDIKGVMEEQSHLLGESFAFVKCPSDRLALEALRMTKGEWIGKGIEPANDALRERIKDVIRKFKKGKTITISEIPAVVTDLLDGMVWPAGFLFLMRLSGIDITSDKLNHNNPTGDKHKDNITQTLKVFYQMTQGIGLMPADLLLPAMMTLTANGISKQATVVFLKRLGVGGELGNKDLGYYEAEVLNKLDENNADSAPGGGTMQDLDWSRLQVVWKDRDDTGEPYGYIVDDAFKPGVERLQEKWDLLVGQDSDFLTMSGMMIL